jgi:23S rRNA (guanosine2251-2'-O)-methyltransferase
MPGKKRGPQRPPSRGPARAPSRAPARAPERPPQAAREHGHRPQAGASSQSYWLHGLHAGRAALENPRRKVRRAVLTERAAEELRTALSGMPVEIAALETIGRLVGPGAVHQGVALLCEPLPVLDLEEFLDTIEAGKRAVAVLDQVTDPHNEGAILRSAAAFGFAAVVVQNRHAAPESGVLAKAASGALDRVARIEVVNIARSLEDLGRLGFWRVALAGDGDTKLSDAFRPGDVALVLGAEGTGLRRLVRERCDIAAFIPTGGASLNVSNAAAVAFYELKRQT